MADENPTAHDAIPDPPFDADPDAEDQALVLDRLLIHWPTHLQPADVERELWLSDNEFERRDRVERAMIELHSAGLVHRCGSVVVPSRSALHYRRLSHGSYVDL